MVSGTSPTPLLREAIALLSQGGLRELYTLMCIGQGNLAAKRFHRGVGEAKTLDASTIVTEIVENPDLHDHIAKALFETGLADAKGAAPLTTTV